MTNIGDDLSAVEGGDNAVADHAMRPLSGKQPLSYEALRDIIDLSLWAGQLLLQYGANSERVEESVHRIGTGLGCNWMDVQVTLDAITITATSGDDFRTKTRRIVRRGVNFKVVTAVNDLGHHVSEGHTDRHQARVQLQQITDYLPVFPRWLGLFAACLACAAFSRLFGGDWTAFLATFIAAGAGAILRQQLMIHYFNPYLIVIATAFVASFVAGAADHCALTATPGVAIIASVLFLVPGVPLINSAQDLMRGYTDNGLSRGFDGLIITLSIAIGVFITLSFFELNLPR